MAAIAELRANAWDADAVSVHGARDFQQLPAAPRSNGARTICRARKRANPGDRCLSWAIETSERPDWEGRIVQGRQHNPARQPAHASNWASTTDALRRLRQIFQRSANLDGRKVSYSSNG